MGNDNRYEGLDEYAVRLIRRKARQLVGRAGFVEADRHDIEQDMMIDLLRRLPRFDPAIAQRQTFIVRIVEHRVATIIEAQKAGLRDFRRCAGSLDERRADHDGAAGDGPPVLDEKEYLRGTLAAVDRELDLHHLRIDLDRVFSDLPVDLRDLCVRLQASPVGGGAGARGGPRGTLYEAIERLRARFERAGLAVYLEGSDRNRRVPVGKG
jgi:RNA polymerase sigma-70 factor (ECF subfamily)